MSNIVSNIRKWLSRPYLSEISNAVSYGDRHELDAVIAKWTII